MLKAFGGKSEIFLEHFNKGTCLMMSGNRIIVVFPGIVYWWNY